MALMVCGFRKQSQEHGKSSIFINCCQNIRSHMWITKVYSIESQVQMCVKHQNLPSEIMLVFNFNFPSLWKICLQCMSLDVDFGIFIANFEDGWDVSIWSCNMRSELFQGGNGQDMSFEFFQYKNDMKGANKNAVFYQLMAFNY